MLVTLLRPFKNSSLLLEADAYAALPLVLPVGFNFLNYLNTLISDACELVELENHAFMIVNE
jgi:hypothetical protein